MPDFRRSRWFREAPLWANGLAAFLSLTLLILAAWAEYGR